MAGWQLCRRVAKFVVKTNEYITENCQYWQTLRYVCGTWQQQRRFPSNAVNSNRKLITKSLYTNQAINCQCEVCNYS